MSVLRRGVVTLIAGSLLAFSSSVVLAAPASAATVSTVVDGVTYTADDADIAAGARATSYAPGPTAVVIPPTVTIGGTLYAVTAIGPSAFENAAITSVVIPDSVLAIGDEAFRASSLTSVDLGEGVQTIGEYAFTNSGGVQAIVIPDSVISIGQWAFDSMDLRTLTIGDGLTSIGTQVFSNNNRLESVTIPSGIVSIGFAAFAADDLRSLVIGSGVTSVGDFAFAYNNLLTSVVVPPSVTTLGDSVFQNNSSGSSFTATFEGAAPSAVGANVFAVSDPLVIYRWRFGAPQTAGGFTSPTWSGAPTQAVATVTFDTLGRAPAPGDQDVPVGSAAAAPPAPSAPGFVFTGWAVAPGGTVWPFASPVTGDLALEAVWAAAPAGSAGTLPATGRPQGEMLPLALLVLALGIAARAVAVRRGKPAPRR